MRTNVIYIHTHDSGRHLSPYGYQVPTKALEAFAEDATLFTHAFCCGPTCSPSRASLLTGMYPHQTGMLGLAQRGFSLNDYSKHFAQFISEKGYRTILSGIQHESGWYLDLEGSYKLGYQEILTTESKNYKKEELHVWDRKNCEAVIDWLKMYDGKCPFFLSYGMHSTHRPFPVQVDSTIDERYVKPIEPLVNNVQNRHDEAQFQTSALYADQNVEMIMKTLKETGLYDNSIILFTTDHGVASPFNKCYLTDAGIGVSLIMRVPGSYSNGKVSDSLISQVDIFPTLCDLLGMTKPEYLEGESFAKIFDDVSFENRQEIFAEINFHTSYEPVRCIRTKRYKYVKYYDDSYQYFNLSNIDESAPKSFYLEKANLKERKKEMEALYDLYYDPLEANNLCDQTSYATVLCFMKQKLKEYQVKTKDPILQGALPLLKGYKVNKKECMQASSKNPEDYEQIL